MKEVGDIWFKYDSRAREWLAKNIDFDESFSKTFRTTGGTFRYYTYEFVLKPCLIEDCPRNSVGSFLSSGGVKLRLCEIHLEHLIELQTPGPMTILLPNLLRIGFPNLVAYLLTHPFISNMLDVSRQAFQL